MRSPTKPKDLVRHDGLSPPKIAFRPIKWDPWIYVFEDDTGFVILMLYVNDVLLLSANKQLLNEPKKNVWAVSR